MKFRGTVTRTEVLHEWSSREGYSKRYRVYFRTDTEGDGCADLDLERRPRVGDCIIYRDGEDQVIDGVARQAPPLLGAGGDDAAA